MPERELILHIGLGKCGTSSLQTFLATNADKLNELGFHYPELEPLDGARKEQVTSGNAALLARSLLDQNNFFSCPDKNKRLHLLEEEVRYRSDRSIILSSEFFSMLEGHQPSKFVQRLNQWGLRVNVVCYLRRQDQIALSTYVQGLIAGHSSVVKSFEEEVADVSKLFKYSRLLAPWLKFEGDNRLTVRVFERSQLINGDIIADFLSVLGLDQERDWFLPTKALNQSLNAASAYLLYLLRKQAIDEAAIQKFVATLRCIDWEQHASDKQLIGDECRRKILDFFDEDNQIVATKFAGKADCVLFEPLTNTAHDSKAGSIPGLADFLPFIKHCIK